jgi:uncharacterized protein
MIYAEHRSSITQFELGQMFRKQEERDYRQSAEWFLHSAQQGYCEAQYKLGLMYSRGLGVSVDYIKAYAWLKTASTQGSRKALIYLKKLVKKIPPDRLKIARELSRRYYSKYVVPFST